MSAAAINPTNFRQDINISKLCNRIQIQDRRMEFFDVKGKIFILYKYRALMQPCLSNAENLVQGSSQYQNINITAI